MTNTERPPHGPRRESNSTLYFIVGALVVAVLVIGWFLYGGTEDPVDDVDVNVESSEPVIDEPAVEPEPVAPEVTEPAPVEPVEPPAADPVPEPTTPAAPEPATPEEPLAPGAPPPQ